MGTLSKDYSLSAAVGRASNNGSIYEGIKYSGRDSTTILLFVKLFICGKDPVLDAFALW